MTQCDKILRHLQDNPDDGITSLQAVKEYGIMRLASRIHDLQKRGYKIERANYTGLNRYGEPTHFTRYWLVQDEQC